MYPWACHCKTFDGIYSSPFISKLVVVNKDLVFIG